MPEIILITLAKNLFHILKNEDGNQKKIVKGGVHPPINPSPINRSGTYSAPQALMLSPSGFAQSPLGFKGSATLR